MWTYFYGQFGDLAVPENYDRCMGAMLQYKHVAFLQPDEQRIRREFFQGETTYARLFALFQEHHAEREGKPRWGDQTGLIERYADQIFDAYPEAQMLHMVRDPRDRYEASLALWPEGKGRAGGATARWKYSMEHAERNQKKYPQGYMLVRFEDLVVNPGSTLKEICDFLDEDYTPSMLTLEGAPKFRAQLERTDEDNLLSEKYIGRYRDSIPVDEVAFMQMYLRKFLEQNRYALEVKDFSFQENLHFWLNTWPKNLFRMYAWLFREGLQQNFPDKFGRTPGARMILKEDSAS